MRAIPLWLSLVPFLLVAFAFGAHGLDYDPIWQDEYFMQRDVRTSDDPLALGVHIAAANPWHVPVYFIMTNAWGRLFGWDAALMRALALLCGLLALAWTYRLGAEHIAPRIGWRAAALLATCAFFVYYTHELRMYTFNALLAALMCWLYLRLVRVRRPPAFAAYLALALTAAVMLYTHYFLALLLAAIAIVHAGLFAALLVRRAGRRLAGLPPALTFGRWWRITAAYLVALALFAPWVEVLIRVTRRVARGDFGGIIPAPEVLAQIAYLFGSGAGLAAAALVAAAAGLLMTRPGRQGAARLLALILLLTVVIVLLANAAIGLVAVERMRYLILLFPPLAVVAALGFDLLGRVHPRLPAAALALWLAFGVVQTALVLTPASVTGYVPFFPVHTLVRTLRPLHQPGDYIAFAVPDTVSAELTRQNYRRAATYHVWHEGLAADWGVLSAQAQAEDPTQVAQMIGALGAGRSFLWLAYPPDPVPASVAPFTAALDPAVWQMCGRAVTTPAFAIDQYAHAPACCTAGASAARPPLARFALPAAADLRVDLLGADLVYDEAAAAVTGYLRFGAALPPDIYSAALHVLDSAGALVAQIDFAVPLDDAACERRTIALSALAPGPYTVRLIVYNWQTGERLTGAAGETSGFDVLRFTRR